MTIRDLKRLKQQISAYNAKEASPQDPVIKILYCPHTVSTCISRSTSPVVPRRDANGVRIVSPDDIQVQLAWYLAGPMQKHNTTLTPNSHTYARSCPACMLTQAISKRKKQSGEEGVRDQGGEGNKGIGNTKKSRH